MLDSILLFFFFFFFTFCEQTVKNLIDAASCDFWSGYLLFTDVERVATIDAPGVLVMIQYFNNFLLLLVQECSLL